MCVLLYHFVLQKCQSGKGIFCWLSTVFLGEEYASVLGVQLVCVWTGCLLCRTCSVEAGVVKHYHIRQNPEQLFYLAEKHSFPTIPELVYYHKHNCAGQLSSLLCFVVAIRFLWGLLLLLLLLLWQQLLQLLLWLLLRVLLLLPPPSAPFISFCVCWLHIAGLVVRLRFPAGDRQSMRPVCGLSHGQLAYKHSLLSSFCGYTDRGGSANDVHNSAHYKLVLTEYELNIQYKHWL